MPFLKIVYCIIIFFSTFHTLIGQVLYFKDHNGIRLYPQSHQLYPRNEKNQAMVILKGTVTNYSIDQVELIVRKRFLDGSFKDSIYSQNTTDTFHFAPIIEAGMYLYSFQLRLKRSQIVFRQEQLAQNVVCGDAYIISGQSNGMGIMVGLPQAGIEQDSLYQTYPRDSSHIFSKSLGNMPEYYGINGHLTNYNPNNNHWQPAKASGSLTGFVGLWGLKLQYLLQEKYQMPTCFINGSYGGSYISQHQLYYSQNNDPYDLHTLFGSLNYRIQQANLKGKIKGVIWYQGESENSYNKAATYADSLNFLIDHWEKYWGNFSKVYVIQIHTGCNHHGYGQIVREQQRSIQRPSHSFSEIIPITACGIGERSSPLYDPYSECHFSKEAYNTLAERLFQVIGRDFYSNNNCITSPNIMRAYYAYEELILEFDQDIATLPDGIEQQFEFYKNNQLIPFIDISNVYSQKNKIHLTIDYQNVDALSYLLVDDPIYNNQMIWLKNTMGYAAFSFHQFPVESLPCTESVLLVQPNIIHQQAPLSIHLKACSTNNKLRIYSVQGQLVWEQDLPSVNIKTTPDLSNLPQGVYFLQVESDGHFLPTQKIVKS
ncbi:sialate O-acetylesterase [Aureispira sp. CCB-E]|uniref:sialate O-acetylesterase n=1 Tax=Aureispira sp. CCB-E TaxID=3051121 RepID=UPI0028694ACA|nr:sialate O-acetylesterase [Aureispira sp. CCB-E]WMX16806.1 sialate O-acetylesterase [Aureispira sp. CCB-E]